MTGSVGEARGIERGTRIGSINNLEVAASNKHASKLPLKYIVQ